MEHGSKDIVFYVQKPLVAPASVKRVYYVTSGKCKSQEIHVLTTRVHH